MLSYLFGNFGFIRLLGLIVGYVLTFIGLKYNAKFLPTDQGRAYAHEGTLSKGKPRGAGIMFVCSFFIAALLFAPLKLEYVVYLLLVDLGMLSGYLDDASENPWNEYKKGALDLIIAVLIAAVYIFYNGSTVLLRCFDKSIYINPILFGVFIVCLVWCSINVTNCSDGVDGLSATLTLTTLGTFYLIQASDGANTESGYYCLIFMACLVAYLWFNATPSLLMMGDAGSRAMGLFIAITALKSGSVFLYFPLAIVLILDGGLGLLKVFLLRFCKIRILTNVRTPLHDQVRKVNGWSNTQCVFRFVIMQLVVNIAFLYLINGYSWF